MNLIFSKQKNYKADFKIPATKIVIKYFTFLNKIFSFRNEISENLLSYFMHIILDNYLIIRNFTHY